MRVLRTDRRMLCREMIYMTYASRPQRRPGPTPEPITETGALGGTRTPTMLLTATSRQRVYQFRHERMKHRHRIEAGPDHRRRCNKSGMEGQGLASCRYLASRPDKGHSLATAGQPRQH